MFVQHVYGRPSAGRCVMSGSRVALVADDQNLAGAVQAHLKKALGLGLFQCTLNDARQHISRQSDGLLLMAATSPADLVGAQRLIQEIYIQKLPPVILL